MTKRCLFAVSAASTAALFLLPMSPSNAAELPPVPPPPAHAPDAGEARDMGIIRQRLRDSLLSSPMDAKAVQAATESLATLQPDGSWADQDYADRDREHWKAERHLPRLLGIAKAYYTPGTSLSGKPEVKAKIIASLAYWLKVDPSNTNWWHNVIGVPLQIGNLLILMGDDAPVELQHQGEALMTRADMSKMTGQNLVWTAQITITRGCLSGDAALVGKTFDRMWEEVRWATKGEEGIQRDASFHQHGPLIYAGGYGAGFTTDISRFSTFAMGTRYALPPEKRAILDAYILDGQQWMIRGTNWDYGVTGRELIRAGKSAAGMAIPFALLASDTSDPRHDELSALAARMKGDPAAPPLSGNRYYWLSDYMAHQRPGYFASTRMFSTRIANTDGLTNGENRTSHHIADGATYLALTGNEYTGIYPVWDWHRIPGTTVEQNTPLVPAKVRRMGTTSFDGGVSDGTYGVAAMDLATGPLTAKKAWFYFDKEIVCLGAGIDCSTDNPVNTTINQCNLDGPVSMSAVPWEPLPKGEMSLPKAEKWVWHGKVGYIFPQASNVHVRNDAQSGSLSLLGPWSTAKVTKDVFSLWIDHGAQPKDATYEYVVVPNVTPAQTAEEAAKLPVEILSNTPQIQAVRHQGLTITEAVFRAPGQFLDGGLTVGVDQPCLVLLRNTGDAVEAAVSNPENAPLTVNLSLGTNTKGHSLAVRFDLPGGLDAGKTVIRRIPAAQ